MSSNWSRDRLRGRIGLGGGVVFFVDFLNRPMIRDIDGLREMEGDFELEIDLEDLSEGKEGFLVNR